MQIIIIVLIEFLYVELRISVKEARLVDERRATREATTYVNSITVTVAPYCVRKGPHAYECALSAQHRRPARVSYFSSDKTYLINVQSSAK